MNSYRLAVVGATGAVGQEILRTLERRNFPVSQLKPLASSRSVGKTVEFQGKKLAVEELNDSAFTGVDYALFSAGATRSRQFADACKKAGAVMIDNSSAFRMKPEVPLVVPEINAADLKKHQGIISVPNCSAIIMCVPLWPLHQAAQIERIIVSTYQSASGAGAQAMAELEAQTRAYAAGEPLQRAVFPHQIAFNVFSHNTAIAENGYNEEENKVIEETRKIFHEPALPVVATCVRVPVLRAHSESIVIETKRELSPEEAREILARAPGVKVVDHRDKNHFPMPLEASGQFDVLVGRIRRDLSHPRGLALFVSGDQLLKGAAWNAVQILEHLVGKS
ncbi:MAG: aspartate-semialdehyde dehydrogenase [Methylacidiphilales bacterium]|nr:aspartate-semialdehyde dehydrogenase [Candidatus Methylacidiphilales bacterium]